MSRQTVATSRPAGLPLANWPAADQAAWRAALAAGIDLFDLQGPAAHWADSTRRKVFYAYGQWLGWLAARDASRLLLAPAERVTRQTITRYIADLRLIMTPSGLSNTMLPLHDAIRVIAPDRDWVWLGTCARRLGRGLQPARKADRMVTGDQLLALGYDLMRAAWNRIAATATPGKMDLLTFRDGIVIALLASRPIRRRNLAMMRLDRHLIHSAGGWHLAFAANETKNRRPIDLPLPSDLTIWLERFLAYVRPRFPGACHDGVWPSWKGRPMHPETLAHAIKSRTWVAFGKSINPHLIRDIAATTIALVAPAQIRASRDLLGHGDLRTTERHYNQANSLAASRRYGLLLDRLRTDTRPDQ